MLYLTGCLVLVNLVITTGGFTCNDRTVFPDHVRCSGTYECEDGKDEISCHISQGILESVFNNTCYNERSFRFTEGQRCDGVSNCDNCFDELDCPDTVNKKYFRCDNDKSKCLPVNFLCDGIKLCDDGSDEKQIGFGFKCNGIPVDRVTGNRIEISSAVPYRCVVPQPFILPPPSNFAKKHSVCFNDEDHCYTLNEDGKSILNISKCWPCLDGTIIQRQQMCDTVFDCADLSDECLCERQFTSEICDPLLRDNNCSRNKVPCALQNKCIDVHQICDGSSDCSEGTDEMRCKNTPDCPTATMECISLLTLNQINATKCDGRFECFSGADECGAGCPEKSLSCEAFGCGPRSKQVCGQSCLLKSMYLCDKVVDCEDKSDEAFCRFMKHCDENDPSSRLYHDHCSDDRCNLVADCENIVDELNCSSLTHFYCDNNKKFFPTYKVFDGVFDCDDYTDECFVTSSSISSHTELIGNKFFYVALWIIMLSAVVGNLIVIIKTSVDIGKANRNANASSSGLCFNIMLFNLAVSDFLMGFYLLLIASKSLEYSGTYCQQKRNWLLSNQCVFSGVLAVASSQMSVCMLVVMASYRLYVVRKPFESILMSWKRLSLIIACLWILSILLAAIPTFPPATNNLAIGIVIDQPYIPQSVSTRQLVTLVETANKLPGERQAIPKVTSLSISSFCSIFNKSSVVPYYCEESSQTTFGSFGYYSTDGVCLPRYFGASNEQAFIYSFVIVLMDFAAFFYMLVVYLVLFYTARTRSQGIPGSANTASRKHAKISDVLSGTIMRIIISDFLCWVPICIMSFLSFGGFEIPGMAYPITAIFLIPINSAVNPWIYSSFLARKVKEIPSLIRIQMQQIQSS